jgi:hypothetical protein
VSADRDITPRVIEYLQTEWALLEERRRPSFLAVQVVLRQLARWARATDVPGHWQTTESVRQIVAGTGLTDGPVRRSLDALADLGLVVTVKRGGGHGVTARGSTRLLVLDSTARASARAVEGGNCARWRPQLRALDTSTARAQARDTASSSVTSSARDADGDAADTGPLPDWVSRRFGQYMGEQQ